jgi:hypothetical protein
VPESGFPALSPRKRTLLRQSEKRFVSLFAFLLGEYFGAADISFMGVIQASHQYCSKKLGHTKRTVERKTA